MSNPEEKATTPTVAEPNTLTRLATFKTPRDLSLGGVKLKKVYTPNLNVTRNKNRGVSLNGTRDIKKDDKKKDRKSEKVKFVKPGQNIIKSGGIFSEGVGSIERFSSRPSYGRDAQSTTTATKLLPAPTSAPPVRNKDFSRRISSLNGDGGLPENRVEFIEDFKRVKALDAPITLPMDDGLTQLKRHFTIKNEAMMKTKRL
ncbi:uncharacterized protein LOC113232674, partial [Hyposmocoma kahamanoa]|uniref:uncharacterized protein LOC113232674 n=1 Tax=Hyposmocoma kahamanoa TaxID=1477025 RepID=UPI000E6D845E